MDLLPQLKERHVRIEIPFSCGEPSHSHSPQLFRVLLDGWLEVLLLLLLLVEGLEELASRVGGRLEHLGRACHVLHQVLLRVMMLGRVGGLQRQIAVYA